VPTGPSTAPLLGLRDPAVRPKQGKLVECRAVEISVLHRLASTEEGLSQPSLQLAQSGCPGASRGMAYLAEAAALSQVMVERHLPWAESDRSGGSGESADLRWTLAALQTQVLRFVLVVVHSRQRWEEKQVQPAQPQEDW